MDVARGADRDLAVRQWETLRQTYLALGHEVEVIDPEPGLPDMVFAANGGLVDRGPRARRPVHPRRAARRGPGLPAPGWPAPGLKDVTEPVHVNEGEGDFLVVGDLVLAGTGFRTDPGAHTEVQELFGIPVVSLQLVDPRFYHLDTALAVLDDRDGRLLPGGVQPGQPGGPAAALPGRGPGHRGRRRRPRAQRGVRRPARRPAVGGRPTSPRSCASAATSRSASTSRELLKAGGSVKCCTLEIRA